jgi:hypothetical protein
MPQPQQPNKLTPKPVEPLEDPDKVFPEEDQVTASEGGGRDLIVGERQPSDADDSEARNAARQRNIARGVPRQTGR